MKINNWVKGAATLGALGLAAGCGSTVASTAPASVSRPAATPSTSTPAATPTTPAAAQAPAQQPVIINNNPAPQPAQTIYEQQPPPVYADPWSVALAYTNDINAGDNLDAWNMLSPSVQQGWNGDYSTYVANFNPLSFDNVSEVSESGDAVTFTFDLDNHSTGSDQPYTCTYTVDNGIITSSTSSPN